MRVRSSGLQDGRECPRSLARSQKVLACVRGIEQTSKQNKTSGWAKEDDSSGVVRRCFDFRRFAGSQIVPEQLRNKCSASFNHTHSPLLNLLFNSSSFLPFSFSITNETSATTQHLNKLFAHKICISNKHSEHQIFFLAFNHLI